MTLVSVLFTLNACLESDDYPINEGNQQTQKKVTILHLNQKDLEQNMLIFEKASSFNQNLFGRGEDSALFEVNLNQALYMTDGITESYTFPIQNLDSITKFNLMLNLEEGEYRPYLIHYDLSYAEYEAYLEGNGGDIDFSNKISITPLENDEVNITGKSGSTSNKCFQLFTVEEDCTCPHHQVDHIHNGFCGHPDVYFEIHYIPCVGGGGGTPPPGSSTPPAPGSGGGQSGGNNDGNNPTPGFTGFVIGDGGTGNQSDVDLINQITWEMDAAFGVGNWDVEMIPTIITTINNNMGINSAVEAVNVIIDEKIDTSGISDTRIKYIYDKLIESNSMSKILSKFNGRVGYTVDNLKLGINHSWINSEGVSLHSTAPAYTISPTDFLITIDFNGNSSTIGYYNNQPDLIMAAIIIHEIIHAHIYATLHGIQNNIYFPNNPNPDLDWSIIWSMLESGSYQDLFLSYQTYYNIYGSGFQHPYMGDAFREIISEAIKAVDIEINGYAQHSDEFYDAISWGGLISLDGTPWNFEPQSWYDLSLPQQNYIINTFTSYFSDFQNSQN